MKQDARWDDAIARGEEPLPTILAINPGSTSTKVALFAGATVVAERTVRHTPEELDPYTSIAEQAPFRRGVVEAFMAESDVRSDDLTAVVGRGGLLHPLETGGTLAVGDDMLADLASERYGAHASNLGALIADAIARPRGIPAFIVDPVVVDEMIPEARLSGMPGNPRRSRFHCLNQRAAAREACERRGIRYDAARLIVAHMGGGVSVAAHRNGRVIDVNDALDGDGPFSPERSGDVPIGPLVQFAYAAGEDEEQRRALYRRMVGSGGLVGYLGVSDLRRARERASSDPFATTVIAAMTLQISQEIAQHVATLEGRVDAIVLTGGMAHDDALVAAIEARVASIAPIECVPGEREMEALAAGALRVLAGEEEARTYEREPAQPTATTAAATHHARRPGSPPAGAPTVAVAGGDSEEVLHAIAEAGDRARFVLCGDSRRIEAIAARIGVALTGVEILHVAAESDEPIPPAWSAEASRRAADLVASGDANVLMKGLVQTADAMRAVLARERNLVPAGSLLFHLARLEIAGRDRPLFLSDGAIVPAPSVADRITMIRVAGEAMRALGVESPRVALIAAAEKVTPRVQSTVDAAEIVARRGECGDVRVDGPMGLDAAVSARAAAIKGIGGEVAGVADMLLFPAIDSANASYKMLTNFTKVRAAGVVLGANVPIVLTSRSDDDEAKRLSLDLALRLASASRA